MVQRPSPLLLLIPIRNDEIKFSSLSTRYVHKQKVNSYVLVISECYAFTRLVHINPATELPIPERYIDHYTKNTFDSVAISSFQGEIWCELPGHERSLSSHGAEHPRLSLQRSGRSDSGQLLQSWRSDERHQGVPVEPYRVRWVEAASVVSARNELTTPHCKDWVNLQVKSCPSVQGVLMGSFCACCRFCPGLSSSCLRHKP